MTKLPTDLALFNYLYREYEAPFRDFDTKSRPTKMYVPIDLTKTATHFNLDPDLIYARFLYYLEEKYSIKRERGPGVSLFLEMNGSLCVNYPYLSAIVADLRVGFRKELFILSASLVAVAISIIALLISVVK